MTAPQRKPLLNSQISAEARRIAHEATKSCGCAKDGEGKRIRKPLDMSNDWHSPACNKLKREIESLALSIKCAAAQPPLKDTAA